MSGDPLKLEMMDDRLLVEQIKDDSEKRTQAGIIVPQTSKERPTEGTVLAVGPGGITDAGERRPMVPQVGDRILYGKFAGTMLPYDDTEYLMLRESDVIAIIRE